MTKETQLPLALFHLHAAKLRRNILLVLLNSPFYRHANRSYTFFFCRRACMCVCVFFFLSLSRIFFVLHRVFSPSLTSTTKRNRQAKEKKESMCITLTSRASFSCEKTYLDETKETEIYPLRKRFDSRWIGIFTAEWEREKEGLNEKKNINGKIIWWWNSKKRKRWICRCNYARCMSQDY